MVDKKEDSLSLIPVVDLGVTRRRFVGGSLVGLFVSLFPVRALAGDRPYIVALFEDSIAELIESTKAKYESIARIEYKDGEFSFYLEIEVDACVGCEACEGYLFEGGMRKI